MKAKKSLTVLFSVSALLIMTAYAGENRSASDNSFDGFDVYTFSAGDKGTTYYPNENTLHIQERSLGSRYNSYDQTITFSTVEKASVPYISTKTTLIIHDPYGNLEKGINSNYGIDRNGAFVEYPKSKYEIGNHWIRYLERKNI